ncbi:MAG: hypothetical protein U0Z70_06340 [Thermomicrobiales bacterium]
MTSLPAWASDLVCEICCEVCQRPVLVSVRDILQAQPVRCACGHAFAPAIPPGLPETSALLAALEATVCRGRASRTELAGAANAC